nr:nicotinate-nucleotide diphosphorylase (carboxylating) [Spirochaetota bacterium]
WGYKYNVEVETRNLEEVKEALQCNVERIMLDNMNLETMKKAVEIIAKKTETEASGNMTLERIKEVAETGVDFISFGELTHTVTVFDFSLKKE